MLGDGLEIVFRYRNKKTILSIKNTISMAVLDKMDESTTKEAVRLTTQHMLFEIVRELKNANSTN